MDDSLYDEVGNYIGPEIESDQDSGWEESDRDKPEESNRAAESDGEGPSNGWLTTGASVDADMLENQVVLAEGKKYYPTAEEVYSEDVETLVMDEDEQPLEQPIIKPVKNKKFEVGVNDSSTYVFEPSHPSPIMERNLTDLKQASRVSENPLPSSSPINLPSSISHKYTTTLASISLTTISSLLHQHCLTKFPNQNFSNQYKMYTLKRHRRQETLHFDKITAHLKKLSYGLSTEHCDPVLAPRKVCAGVYRGATTSQLDELAAETAVGMMANHPDYASLAAKTVVSNMHKHTKDSFSETVKIMYNHFNHRSGKKASLIANDVYEIIIENATRLDNGIIYDRDFDYDYFGFKNLDMSSLLKVDGTVVERPQHMIMRVSVGIHKHDIKYDVKTYHLMSQRWFTHVSPTLFNAGTPRAKGGKNQKAIARLVLAVKGWNLPVSADEEKTSNIPEELVSSSLACLAESTLSTGCQNPVTKFHECPLLNITYCPATKVTKFNRIPPLLMQPTWEDQIQVQHQTPISVTAPSNVIAAPNANQLVTTSLYVGDLELNVSDSQLYELFNQVGQVVSARVCRDLATLRSLGYGYVNFNNPQDAARALDVLNFTPLNNNSIKVIYSHRDPSIRKSGSANIFIKNLDKTIDHKALHDTFSTFGHVLSCKIATDGTGQSKGYVFVQFENAESAQNAIDKLNGMLINDKQVYVGHFLRKQDRDNILNVDGEIPAKFVIIDDGWQSVSMDIIGVAACDMKSILGLFFTDDVPSLSSKLLQPFGNNKHAFKVP